MVNDFNCPTDFGLRERVVRRHSLVVTPAAPWRDGQGSSSCHAEREVGEAAPASCGSGGVGDAGAIGVLDRWAPPPSNQSLAQGLEKVPRFNCIYLLNFG